MKRVAIVGGGAAGISAALELAEMADVRLFESDSRLGGHALSIPVEGQNGISFPVDVGFMVLNRGQYPTLIRAFERLGGIELGSSEMSFAYWDTLTDASYILNLGPGSRSDTRVAATIAPHLPGILHFMRAAERDAREQRVPWQLTLGEYLDQLQVPPPVRELYVVPMTAALWSVPAGKALSFSALRYLQFCLNHGLLSLTSQFKWCHVRGGSVRYVEAARRHLGERVILGHPVVAVKRSAAGVALRFADGTDQSFDAVVMATHGDTTRRVLVDCDASEAELLDVVRYQSHEAVLHRCPMMLPKSRAHWASWNVARSGSTLRISYHLNSLQTLPAELGDVFVTLDAREAIPDSDVIARIPLEHPILDVATAATAQKIPELQGHRRTYYAGAWLGNGFHEDAFASGARAAAACVQHLTSDAA